MDENIQFNIIDEVNKDEDINLCQLIDNIENTFVIMNQNNNYEELDLENIKVSQIIDYIQKNIIIYKNLCYDNIIYINSFFPNLYKIINNIKNYDVISNNNIIDLNNNKRIIINSIENIYLIMFNYITNIVDLIIILIFYILTKKYIFYLLNNNFIIHNNNFKNIFTFDIRDKIYIF